MKFDSFLTSPRWEILQILAKTPSSPVELAEKLRTTVAYMSQQLKLLDAANLVIKTKTGASEKGKPRSIYKISNEMIYNVVISKELAEKKLLVANDHHKTVMKIWMIENSKLHYYFEKVYFKLDESKKDLSKIYLDLEFPKFVVVDCSSKVKSLIQSYINRLDVKVDCDFVSSSQFKNLDKNKLISIYDPSFTETEVKGGLKEVHDG